MTIKSFSGIRYRLCLEENGGEEFNGLDFERIAENRVGANVANAVQAYFSGIDLSKPGTHRRPELPYTVTVRKVDRTLFDPAGYLAVTQSYGIDLAEVLTPRREGELSRFTLHLIYPHLHIIGGEPVLEPVSVTSRNSGNPAEWLVEIQTRVPHGHEQGSDLTRQDGQRILEQHGLI
ncbi:MAG: hypothetical protein HY426_02665 [Candidatus Levybacteria bacterium]|nr:hypothetical protein [Candidatus Levybacteria bacterium]